LADDAARLDQRHQNVEGAPAELDGLAVSEELTAMRQHLETAERDAGRWFGRRVHHPTLGDVFPGNQGSGGLPKQARALSVLRWPVCGRSSGCGRGHMAGAATAKRDRVTLPASGCDALGRLISRGTADARKLVHAPGRLWASGAGRCGGWRSER
ncbi:MAG TPA: hypothetical protein VE690_18465, partial [Rhodopila sp.]|nr:hypothetical protein [Rhodopila sp.]